MTEAHLSKIIQGGFKSELLWETKKGLVFTDSFSGVICPAKITEIGLLTYIKNSNGSTMRNHHDLIAAGIEFGGDGHDQCLTEMMSRVLHSSLLQKALPEETKSGNATNPLRPPEWKEIIMRPLALCLFLVALPGAAEVVETLTYHTYNVPDNPRKSLGKSITEVSPLRENGRTFHGYTKWFVSWRYKWDKDSNGRCTITDNKVTVRGEITLPDANPSDPEQRQQFSTYITNLRTHELGHFQIAQTVAKKIDEQILSLPGMESCKLLGKRANEIGNELLAQTKQIELDYDRTTEHGRTQGAWLEK